LLKVVSLPFAQISLQNSGESSIAGENSIVGKDVSGLFFASSALAGIVANTSEIRRNRSIDSTPFRNHR